MDLPPALSGGGALRNEVEIEVDDLRGRRTETSHSQLLLTRDPAHLIVQPGVMGEGGDVRSGDANPKPL